MMDEMDGQQPAGRERGVHRKTEVTRPLMGKIYQQGQSGSTGQFCSEECRNTTDQRGPTIEEVD